MVRGGKKQASLERFGLRFKKKFILFKKQPRPAEPAVRKPARQTKLESRGVIFEKAGHTAGIPLHRYRRLKEIQKRKQEAIGIFYRQQKQRPAPVALGKGREFAVFYYKGFNFGVAAKRQKEKEAAPSLKRAVEMARMHRRAQTEFREAGISVPKLYATQMHLKPIMTHYVERVHPLIKKGRRQRVAPEEFVEAFVPQIVSQLRTAGEKGLVIDSLVENWGISQRTGKVIYIDTFHAADAASKELKEEWPFLEFTENVLRFVYSAREFYSPKEHAKLVRAVVAEVEKQFPPTAVQRIKKEVKHLIEA